MNLRSTSLVLAGLILSAGLSAQAPYTLKKASLAVEGTSTLHDWEMKAARGTGRAQLNLNGSKLVIQELRFAMNSEDLKSESSTMDKNAYKSLKSDQHKQIIFQVVQAQEFAGQPGEITVNGRLQIAGVTKDVRIRVVPSVDSAGNMTFKGETALKMSDYKIEPPSFMFGAMKTGDEVTIRFEASFSRNAIVSTN